MRGYFYFKTLLILYLSWLSFASNAHHFDNAHSIEIKDNAPASLFPSTIGVFGLEGFIKEISITLHGVSHPNYNDVHIVLQGPEGQSILLQNGISKQGGNIDGITYTFKDGWPNLPEQKEIQSRYYKPTQYDESSTFQYPAPKSLLSDSLQGYQMPGPFANDYASLNAVFGGRKANGLWKIFIQDLHIRDEGIILKGWSLDIETECYEQKNNEIISNPLIASISTNILDNLIGIKNTNAQVQSISFNNSTYEQNKHSEAIQQKQRLFDEIQYLHSEYKRLNKVFKLILNHQAKPVELLQKVVLQFETEHPEETIPIAKLPKSSNHKETLPETMSETMENLSQKFDPELEDVKFETNQKMREAYIVLQAKEGETCTIKIFDVSGSTKLEQKYKMHKGVNSIYISTGKLDSGKFNLIYELDSHSGIVKFEL